MQHVYFICYLLYTFMLYHVFGQAGAIFASVWRVQTVYEILENISRRLENECAKSAGI